MFLVPLAFTVVFSFGHSSFGGITPGFTLDNYRQALSGFYLDSFLRTIRDIPLRIDGSLIGRNVRIVKTDFKPKAYRFMLGDNSEVGIT